MTNEKWRDNPEWAPFQEDFKQAYIEPLVAEAMRRGEENAWEEARSILTDLLGIGMDESVRFKIEDIDAKLTSLKTP